jgi:hypothetical protein
VNAFPNRFTTVLQHKEQKRMPHEMGDEEDERSYVTPASTKGKPPALTAFTYVYGLVTRARGEEMMVDDRGSYMDDTFAGAKVFVSRSTDAGVTWSSPTQMPGGGDEFNQWLAVDPTDGSVNVAYYDTGTPGAAATVYTLARSTTQGASYSSQAIANAPTDETTGAGVNLGNQYGDYEGIAALGGIVHPVWMDRRSDVITLGLREEVFTAALSFK